MAQPEIISEAELQEWRAAGFTDAEILAYRCMGIQVAHMYVTCGDYDTPSSLAMRERIDHDPVGIIADPSQG